MTIRIFDKYAHTPAYIAWHEVWPDSPGVGRACKRALAKANRRLAREEIAYEMGEITRVRARGLANAMSEVNWRTH